MPRAKKEVEFRTQVYDIGNDATVTIRYRADKRPAMRHEDTSVIVGEKATVATIIARQPERRAESDGVPTSNGPTEDTPEILALKARLPADPSRGQLPFGAKTQDLWGGEDVSPEALEGLAAMVGGN